MDDFVTWFSEATGIEREEIVALLAAHDEWLLLQKQEWEMAVKFDKQQRKETHE